jgi:hypothetical protein
MAEQKSVTWIRVPLNDEQNKKVAFYKTEKGLNTKAEAICKIIDGARISVNVK